MKSGRFHMKSDGFYVKSTRFHVKDWVDIMGYVSSLTPTGIGTKKREG